MSVAMEETKYESKFQLCSSSSLGDMPILVAEIKNWKGDRFDHLFVHLFALAEISKVHGASEVKFSKSKKVIENRFFEVVLSGLKN